MINLPFYKVLNLDIPTHIKYWIIKNKQIPKHLLEIIDQTPPITLENTLALPLENFKIHGKTSQNSLSGKNLFDKNSILSGYRISSAGQNLAQNNYFISDFIKVSPNTTYTKNSPVADVYHRFAFYESNDQESYISKVDDNNTATTPATCNYLRFCGKLEELNTTQLEESSSVTTYEEYCGRNSKSKSRISTTNSKC